MAVSIDEPPANGCVIVTAQREWASIELQRRGQHRANFILDVGGIGAVIATQAP